MKPDVSVRSGMKLLLAALCLAAVIHTSASQVSSNQIILTSGNVRNLSHTSSWLYLDTDVEVVSRVKPDVLRRKEKWKIRMRKKALCKCYTK